jgi:hypothetical protein
MTDARRWAGYRRDLVEMKGLAKDLASEVDHLEMEARELSKALAAKWGDDAADPALDALLDKFEADAENRMKRVVEMLGRMSALLGGAR